MLLVPKGYKKFSIKEELHGHFLFRILEEEILKETKRIQTDLIRKVGREEEEDRIE